MRLNLASGATTWPGFVNSDVEPFSDREDVERVDLDRPLPYADASADLIMISHGICLRPDKPAVVREMARVVKPGGWLRIDDNPYRIYEEGGHRDEHEHLHWPRAELVALLVDLGFDVFEHAPEDTLIPADDELAQAIVGNHHTHVSFCVEAQRAGD